MRVRVAGVCLLVAYAASQAAAQPQIKVDDIDPSAHINLPAGSPPLFAGWGGLVVQMHNLDDQGDNDLGGGNLIIPGTEFATAGAADFTAPAGWNLSHDSSRPVT